MRRLPGSVGPRPGFGRRPEGKRLAQRSGAGDAAMDKIAQALTEDGELSLEEKVSRAEPALVLVCSVLVGLILLSVMLPLMHIMAAIG